MAWHKRFDPSEVPDFDPKKTDYSHRELDLMAESLLREDARREKCRTCEQFGELTGEFIIKDQFDRQGKPTLDEAGKQLRVKFPEYVCENDHKWFKGEGKAKGIGGENPILFEEHIIQRKRREIMSVAGTVDPSIVEGMYHRCCDVDTEILTSEKWKRVGELNIGDLVWAYDIKTDTCKWCPVLDIYINKNFKGPLYSLESKQISARVTEGHRWAVVHEHHKDHRYEVKTSFSHKAIKVESDPKTGRFIKSDPHETLVSRHYIPLARKGSYPQQEDRPELYELLGWVITDGTYKKDKPSRFGCLLYQALHNPKIDDLKKCLLANNLDVEPKSVDQNNVGCWYINTKIGKELRQIAPEKRLSCIDFSQHSFYNLKALLDGVIFGDGSLIKSDVNDNIQRIAYTTNRHEADAIQALCTVLGITTSLTWRFDPKSLCPMAYFIYLKEQRRARFAYVRNAMNPPEYYTGTIWCPSVETGFWMARRNGKVYVTGNSHPQGRRFNSPAERRAKGLGFYS